MPRVKSAPEKHTFTREEETIRADSRRWQLSRFLSACQSPNQASKSIKSKELSVDLRDGIVSRHRSGEGYRKISAALNVPMSTVASIIRKWKKFGTTRTLPRAGRPVKLSDPGGKALDREVTKNPMVSLTELQRFSVEREEPSSTALHQSGQCDRVAGQKPLFRKRQMMHNAACQTTNQALKSMKTKELSVDLRDRIVSRHRSGEGYKKISTALNVPVSTIASIILKWKKFGTTTTLPRAGRPVKLSDPGGKALDREVTKNPMVSLTELRCFSVEKEKPSSTALHQSGQCDRVAGQKPLFRKSHMMHNAACQTTNQALKSKKSIKSKELSVDLRDGIVSRHRSGEGYRKISAALNVPMSTVASIIRKWKKFGTTTTLPRAGRPVKLSDQGGKALDREVTKNPMVSLTELLLSVKF
ncbi:uncharacterized protein [Pseudorasbora parva]|uniref:uncharacterized protein n=1 Tax=Pseudorasbora parva TaxID=51549 RepID=UPI00351F33C8